MEQKKLLFKIKEVKDGSDLYCHYGSKLSPQPVFLMIDCENAKVEISYDPEIGNAIPFSVFHGREHWVPVQLYMSAEQANDLLLAVSDELQKVFDGYSSHWDGSNHVGTLTKEAEAALKEIERTAKDWNSGGFVVCNAGDFFGDEDWGALGIDKNMSVEEIEVLLEELAEESGECDLIEGVENMAQWIYAEMQEDQQAK